MQIEEIASLHSSAPQEGVYFLIEGRACRVVLHDDRGEAILSKQFSIYPIEFLLTGKTAARKLNLREEVEAILRFEVNFESLCRLRLLRTLHGGRGDLDNSVCPHGGSDTGQRFKDLFLEGIDRGLVDIEVHVLGVAAASKEEAQVDAPLEGDELRVESAQKSLQKGEVEDFSNLEGVQQHGLLFALID